MGTLRIFDQLLPEGDAVPAFSVVLPFADRQRSRLRVTLTDGSAAGIKLPRGTLLRDQQRLCSSRDGGVLLIKAAPEAVSEVHERGQRSLARAAYHLGNRHVWVELGPDWLRYLRDPVLDRMLTLLGYTVVRSDAPFDPEAGAYAAGRPDQDHAH